jgi:predicted nucleic acid-binding Zn ribbon protein
VGSGDRRAPATSIEEAASAVQRALLTCIGPGAAEQIALAQARLAWQEVAAEAGLSRGPMHSRLTRVSNGAARVEASDAMVASELRLRADALAWAVNQRMQDRPGASLRITSLTIVVGREGRGGSL